MELKDEDIKKASSCCVKGDCFRCPLDCIHNCRTALREGMHNILNKQQIELVLKRNTIDDLNNKLTEKQSENKKLQSLCTSKDVIINEQEAEIERLNGNLFTISNACMQRRNEAIKEFAERLKKEAVTKCDWDNCVDVEDIDRLVAEMVGEQNA